MLPDTFGEQLDQAAVEVATSRELLIVDAAVVGARELLVGLRDGIETVVLMPERDGLEQLLEAMARREDLEAVHIVAHGEAGVLRLGNLALDHDELERRADAVRHAFRQAAPSNAPDLILYACNLARGEIGETFVQRIAELTEGAVAASTDVTGRGGDWDLELQLGSLSTPQALSQAILNDYPHRLATYTVTKTEDTDDGTCDADCSLREAIAASNSTSGGADLITFAAGLTGTITLTNGILTVNEPLVINGPGADVLAVSGNNASGIFDVEAKFTLRSLTLRDGSTTDRGGAIQSAGELTITDSIITNNSSGFEGGGIYAYAGNVTIERTVISNNSARDKGGALSVELDQTTFTLIDSEIRNNSAGDKGGGISFVSDDSSDNVTIRNCTITGNTATNTVTGKGGGIAFYADDEGGTMTVGYSTISSNTAAEGGGIRFYSDDDGYLIVRNSTVSDNQANSYEGGGIWFYSDDGRLTIQNSTITGNEALDTGGGIHIEETGNPTYISLSTVVDNRAGNGGGIFVYDKDVVLENSIVANNTATVYNPDIGTDSDSISIFSRHSLIGDPNITDNSSVIDEGGSLLGVAPLLGPLTADAGGPTQVHLPLFGSPVLNAGQAGVLPLPVTDQRGTGFPRILEGRLDMGAVELIPTDPKPRPVPTLQGWLFWLLALLVPAVALRYRRHLDGR